MSALLLSRRIASQLKYDDMGTTFGGGPMACAVAEAVIDTIESESLLANVRQVSAYIRSQLHHRSGHRRAGRGFLARPEDLAARQGSAGGAAGEEHSHRHQRAIRISCVCCRRTS